MMDFSKFAENSPFGETMKQAQLNAKELDKPKKAPTVAHDEL
jgi:hypothetical protein